MPDIKDLLDQALPASDTPLAVTRDSALHAGRSALRRRRTLVVSAAAGLATVAVLATSLALAGGPAATPLPPASPTVLPTPTSTPRVGPTVTGEPFRSSPRPVVEDPQQAAARLTAALRAAAAPATAGFTLSPVTTWSGQATEPVPPLAVLAEGGGFNAYANLTDEAGTGYLSFGLFPDRGALGVHEPSFNEYCATLNPQVIHCETRVGPGGEHIGVLITPYSGGDSAIDIMIYIKRPDGTALLAHCVNLAWDEARSQTRPAERPTPPLTADQLVDILTAPALTLYP